MTRESHPQALERFRQALGIPTVTPGEGILADENLQEFQQFLLGSYPSFSQVAQAHFLDDFGLWFHWKTKNQNPQELPILLMAHYDVVPVETEHWTFPPFDAQVCSEKTPGVPTIYARGALDTKNTLIGIMEAVEALAARGFAPSRDLYLAFGGDEERNGIRGARKIAQEFQSQGITFDWVLDEGSVVADGSLKAARVPLALVAVEEKGYLNLVLSVTQAPGHSARPPKIQAAAILGRALERVARVQPRPRLIPSVEGFFKGLAPFVDRLTGILLSRPRLFWPVIHRAMASNPAVLAMFRTTTALTTLEGSPAENILPSEVRGVVNCRILPGDTTRGTQDRIRRIVADPRVRVEQHPDFLADEPVEMAPGLAGNPGLASNMRPAGGTGPAGHAGDTSQSEGGIAKLPGWNSLKAAIEEIFPGCPVIPYLNTAQTDSRHYARLTSSILRFAPAKLTSQEIDTIHGHDERISVDNFYGGIRFFTRLIEISAGPELANSDTRPHPKENS